MHESTRGGSGRRRRRRRLQQRPGRSSGARWVTMWGWTLTQLVVLWAAAAMAAPDRENAIAGARAAGKSKVCGLPGAPPCRSSEEDSMEDGGAPAGYENYPDHYGTYDDGMDGMDDNASRVDGNIPVLEAFPLLEPKPHQHAQMMLQEAPPFTWLVQSDTPPRSGKMDLDPSNGSLLSNMPGGKRPGGRGKGGSSRERGGSRERSVALRQFHI